MLTGSDQIHIFEYGGSRVTELDSEKITRLSFLYQTCLSELYVSFCAERSISLSESKKLRDFLDSLFGPFDFYLPPLFFTKRKIRQPCQ